MMRCNLLMNTKVCPPVFLLEGAAANANAGSKRLKQNNITGGWVEGGRQ